MLNTALVAQGMLCKEKPVKLPGRSSHPPSLYFVALDWSSDCEHTRNSGPAMEFCVQKERWVILLIPALVLFLYWREGNISVLGWESEALLWSPKPQFRKLYLIIS